MKMTELFIAIFFFFTISIQAQVTEGDSWAKVNQIGSGTVNVIFYSTQGLIEQQSDGSMKGMCVDIIGDFEEYVASTYAKKVQFNYVSEATVWMSFLTDVKKAGSGVLGVANTSITPTREKEYAFTPSYINSPLLLLTHKNAAKLTSLDQIKTSLVGYSAKVVSGSMHVDYMIDIKNNFYPDLNIQYGTSAESILSEMAENEKLFTMVDFTEFFYAIKNRFPIKRQMLTISDTDDQLAFVMPKGSDWEPIWKEFLSREYKASSRYKEIVTRNLGHQFVYLIN